LSAIGDVFRSLPDRLRRPESLIMIMALLASVGAHLPPYIGLGALADYFEHQEAEAAKHRKAPPVEVSFEVAPTPAPEEPKAEPPEPEKPKQEKPKKEPEKKAEAAKPEEQPKPIPQPEPEKPKVAVSEVQLPEPPPPPPQQERKQSITQKSEDPNVEPPPDAKYLAEENRRVEEETVASVTSETRDDNELQAAAPLSANAPEKSGEDLEKDERGAEKGADTEEPPQVASVQKQAQPQPAPEPPPSAQKPQENGRQAVPGRDAVKQQEAAPTVVHDPLGSFTIAPSVAQREAREGKQGQRGKAAASGANLRVSWRTFEDTFGAQQLAQDRMPREAKRRGAGREKRWEEFRAAIENYIVGVKPGNQTRMNALADPFAAYLAAFHRNLHMEFAHDFLESLPALGELGNPDLVTKVEIVVNPDGTLDRVGVVKSSGNLMYDFGAFNAVQRGAPYPPPPEKIRSTDGRVYMRWALHRNESQCGTWNAEPYILNNPPRGPNDPKPDGMSPFRGPGEKGEQNHVPPGSAPRAGETLGLNLLPRLLERSRLEG
jgi:TonB family protein